MKYNQDNENTERGGKMKRRSSFGIAAVGLLIAVLFCFVYFSAFPRPVNVTLEGFFIDRASGAETPGTLEISGKAVYRRFRAEEFLGTFVFTDETGKAAEYSAAIALHPETPQQTAVVYEHREGRPMTDTEAIGEVFNRNFEKILFLFYGEPLERSGENPGSRFSPQYFIAPASSPAEIRTLVRELTEGTVLEQVDWY